MIENYFNRVGTFYNSALNSAGEERDRHIYDLTLYLEENRYYWSSDPLADPSHPFSYRTMRNLTGSEGVSFHLQQELDVIESVQVNLLFSPMLDHIKLTKNFNSLYQWVNAHQATYSLSYNSGIADFLGALDQVRLNLLAKNLYSSNLDFNISKFVMLRFNLSSEDSEIDLSGVANNRDHQLRILAHACTRFREFVPNLYVLNQDELKKVAVHFYKVPMCTDTNKNEWFKGFLKLCETARVVDIRCAITSLSSNDLPPYVEELNLFNTEIERLSLTLPKLKKFESSSKNERLRFIELNAPHVIDVKIYGSSDLSTFRLNTPHLERLHVNGSSLTSLNLDTPFLSTLWIVGSNDLNSVTLVHSDRLRTVSFEGCSCLRSFLEPGRGLPNCRSLCLFNCPAAIPQVPTTTEVLIGERLNRRDFISFRVNPKHVVEKPLQVLLDLGRVLKNQTYFPNIIWINTLTEVETLGADAGGLRRHFVASLTENLPPHLEDKVALETYGRLIGFAAESSLLFGSTLPLQFFYELLSEENSLKEIISGVKATLGLNWDRWKRNPQETDANFTNRVRIFADQVQGKAVTLDNLFPLLQFHGENTLKTEEYFQRFFSEFPLLVDERVFQLKHFHQLMLGSLSLEGRPITIHVKGPGDWLPPIHACSGEMEIPTYPDYQTFKEKLKWAFRAQDTFETI